MMNLILGKCSGCGLELSEAHRKGDMLFCPACKKYYKITIHVGKKIGKCPYPDCGEVLTQHDLKDGILTCPHCHQLAFERELDYGNSLLQYKGICLDCGTKIGDSDCQADGVTYKCPKCSQILTTRDGYVVRVIKDYCPACNSPLCSDDISAISESQITGQFFNCSKCGNGFLFDSSTKKIPRKLLYAIPRLNLETFKYRSFKRMMAISPEDVASKMHITSERVDYFPSNSKQIACSEKVHIFTTELTDVERVFGGRAAIAQGVNIEDTSATLLLTPSYRIEYTYKDSTSRSFVADDLSEEISDNNIPQNKHLVEKDWGSKFFMILIAVVIIAAAIWWWNASNGFFSGLINIIVAVIVIVVAFPIGGFLSEAIDNQMETKIMNRKIQDFKRIYNFDFSRKDTIKDNNG